jgi:glycosyltransferase involved in cell wall biosynthesis
MKDTRVSILTPTYNHEGFISDCIKSVLKQSYPHWELLILDDGSTDATPKIARSFEDPRIRYLRQENQGRSRLRETYNWGLRQARGGLVAILEGDDFWPQDKLEKQTPVFEDPEVVLSYGFCQKFVEGKVLGMVKCGYGKWPETVLNNKPVGAILPMLLSLDGHQPPAVTVMARKSALERIGGFLST